MKKTLVLFAHPALEKSRVNRVLIEGLEDMEGITFHDLYEAYPDLAIDVAREKELLTAHDVVVMQHPFFWYSTPAILKEWQDLVLQHGWAYGSEGTALHGKCVLSAITTGGREATYAPSGTNRFTMRELLAPLEQTMRLCGMDYLPPFVVHGTHCLDDRGIARQAEDYRRALLALRDGRVDLAAARHYPRLNTELGAILED